MENPFFQYWWFHLPNLVLAALMYTMLGRVVLGFLFPPPSTNYIMTAFARITDPVLRPIRYLTPLAVPPLFVMLLAVVWLFAARIAIYMTLLATGLAPTLGVTPQ